jgi:hypothetical protein
VPIYRRPIDKWAQAQFGIIDNLICRDFGSTPGDTYCLILQWIFPKTRFKGLSYRSNTATICRPTVDGWALISTCFLKYGVIHAYSRKLRLCPFIARPPMDGHISGTMRKPFQFSFQNNRQN